MHNDGLGGVAGQMEARVVPSLLDTSSVHTRTHGDFVVHTGCPAIFSLLSTAVFVCCVYVCPRSKPHVLDGKGGRLSSKKRLPAFILVRSLFPVMDLGSTF